MSHEQQGCKKTGALQKSVMQST